MERAEFDQFADEYAKLHASSIAASGEGPEYFARYKIQDVLSDQKRRGHMPTHILDFGAGVGSSVPYWASLFPRVPLVCLDVSQRSLDIGSQKYSTQAKFTLFDGRTIPFPAHSFDVAFAACVFHHIDAEAHVALFRELCRVLTPGGTCYVFEHNPLNPLTLQAVNRCEFDRNAVLIRAGVLRRRLVDAGFHEVTVAYRIFFPRALRLLRPLEAALRWLPIGAQYCVTARPT